MRFIELHIAETFKRLFLNVDSICEIYENDPGYTGSINTYIVTTACRDGEPIAISETYEQVIKLMRESARVE